MSESLFVYVVCANEGEAEKISRGVVRKRLAACANVLGACKSFFYWKGRLEECRECALVLKTTQKKFAALEKQIRELHSYENPAIVAMPIARGSRGYLKWIAENAR